MNRDKQRVSRLRRFQTGQAIVLIALAMIVLLLFVGLAIDANRLFELKRRLQNTADAAAMAAAYQRCAEEFYAETNTNENLVSWDGIMLSSSPYFSGANEVNLLGSVTQAISGTIRASWKYDALQQAKTVTVNNGFSLTGPTITITPNQAVYTAGNTKRTINDPGTNSQLPNHSKTGSPDTNYL